jgi:hypothetical protein
MVKVYWDTYGGQLGEGVGILDKCLTKRYTK